MSAGNLRVGTAKADITPSSFSFMAGMGNKRNLPRGVHDPLLVKALVVDNGEKKIAIACADMEGINAVDTAVVRRLVGFYTDIKPENVMVACSHTHNGPMTLRFFPLWNIEGIDEEMQARLDGYADTLYLRYAAEKIAGAIYEANNNLVDAEVGMGSGSCEGNINRWHLDENGVNQYIPYNDKRLSANQVCDEQVNLIAFRSIDGSPLATLYNYTAHPICVCMQDDYITADFPAWVAEKIEEDGGLCMFTQGAEGDIHPAEFDKGLDAAARLGYRLGESIQVIKSGLTYESSAVITVAEKEVGLVRKDFATSDTPEFTYIQVMSINDFALVAWPAEPWVRVGLRIKESSPFEHTSIVCLANDYKGYFAMESTIEGQRWSTQVTIPKTYTYDAVEDMVAASLVLLHKAKLEA